MDADFSREGGIPLKFSERVFENKPLIKTGKVFGCRLSIEKGGVF
ncbi:hypothetical protein [Novacetimonas hansenii]|nr:hypothetical protein [Novacetimonas hansenii]